MRMAELERIERRLLNGEAGSVRTRLIRTHKGQTAWEDGYVLELDAAGERNILGNEADLDRLLKRWGRVI